MMMIDEYDDDVDDDDAAVITVSIITITMSYSM